MTLYKIRNITEEAKAQPNTKRDRPVTLERKERRKKFFHDFWASSHRYVRARSSFGKIQPIAFHFKVTLFFRVRIYWKIEKNRQGCNL